MARLADHTQLSKTTVEPPNAPTPPPPVASQATQAAGSAVTGGVAITEPGPTGFKGWFAELYNPANPWLGYLRAALTIIVLAETAVRLQEVVFLI